MVATPEEIYARADMIVKVKEPQAAEWPLLAPRADRLHLFPLRRRPAADRGHARTAAITAVAYETLRDDRGRLPLLTPMSEVAGRMSIQEGAKYLERPQMGRGILLGGVPGVEPAHIAILGGGVVGANAAKVAAGFGANIAHPRHQHGPAPLPRRHHAAQRHRALFSDRHTIREQLAPGRPGDRRGADARRQGPAAGRAAKTCG